MIRSPTWQVRAAAPLQVRQRLHSRNSRAGVLVSDLHKFHRNIPCLLALIRIERDRVVVVEISLRNVDPMQFGSEHFSHLKVPLSIACVSQAGIFLVNLTWSLHTTCFARQSSPEHEDGPREAIGAEAVQSTRFLRLPSMRSRIARAASSTLVPGPNTAATPLRNKSG
jgi:hypothetical protein